MFRVAGGDQVHRFSVQGRCCRMGPMPVPPGVCCETHGAGKKI